MIFGVAAIFVIGVKSLMGSYPVLGLIAGLAAEVETVAAPMMKPSLGARASSSATKKKTTRRWF